MRRNKEICFIVKEGYIGENNSKYNDTICEMTVNVWFEKVSIFKDIHVM